MRYIASAFGSAGDFLPTLAVARLLARDGHDVTFVTNSFHERTVRGAGLDCVTAGEHVDLYQLIVDDPGLLTSPRVLKLLVDLAGPHFTATFHLVREMLRAERVDAVVGSNLAFGLLWAGMSCRVPTAMVAATPLGWISRHAADQPFDFEVPTSMLSLVLGAVRAIGFGVIDHELRAIARAAGATAFDPSYTAVESRVTLHAGMWPALLRPPNAGDLPNMRACGFVRAGHLGTTAPALPADLEAFLAAGPAPVVIALGSIFSLGSDEVVADAAEACVDVGKRCVLVGPPPRARALPEGTLVVPYATYELLFSRAAALVIHGGVGTTGEALKSGRPAVVVPFAFDQFGLSWHVERLGAGVRVGKRGRSRKTLAIALRRVLEDASLAAGSAEVAQRLRTAPDGAEVTARLITEMT